MEPLIGAMSLVEVPGHRQAALLKQLRRRAGDVIAGAVGELIAELSAMPCPVPTAPADPARDIVAAQGDDGRYHLVINSRLVCGAAGARRRVTILDGEFTQDNPVFLHRQTCWWWTSGTRTTVNPPRGSPPGPAGTGRQEAVWTVRLTGHVWRPELVPPRRRCAPSTSGPLLMEWPLFVDPTTTKGRIRAALVGHLGSACHACGVDHGVFIDHCHDDTRLVRGLLCRFCNTHVDGCPHLAGCRWATYLDHPPAESLGLRYPR